MKLLLAVSVLAIVSAAFLTRRCPATSKASSEESEEAKQNIAPDINGVIYLVRSGQMYASTVFQQALQKILPGPARRDLMYRTLVIWRWYE